MGRHRDPDQPRDPLARVDITLTLPRQIIWLLAGIAVSHVHVFGGLVEMVGHVLRGLAG